MKTQFQTEILPRETKRTLNIPLTPSAPGVVHCFTDGSKNERSIVRGSGITFSKLRDTFNSLPD